MKNPKIPKNPICSIYVLHHRKPKEGGATVPEALPVPRVRTVPAIPGGPASGRGSVDRIRDQKGPLKDVRIYIHIQYIYICTVYIYIHSKYSVYIHTYVYI